MPSDRCRLGRAADGNDHRGTIGQVVHTVIATDLTAATGDDTAETVDETFPAAVEIPHPATEAELDLADRDVGAELVR